MALTLSPLWVVVALQALVIFWSPGKVEVVVQPLMAVVPLLVMVTLAVKPPGHSLVLA